MTRSEYTFDGILTHVIIDNGDGTGVRTDYNEDGTVAETTDLTDLEPFVYPPLDHTGALATLLVVLELVPLQDASNAIGEEPDHLIAEATAWSLAQG